MIMKDTARWTVLVALFTIPFIPLYVASDLFFPFITGKGFAFRIVVEIAAVAFVLLALLDHTYRPKFTWVLALFGGFVAWMFVANMFGVLPHKAFWSNYERMDGWVTLIHLFALFVVAGTVLSVEKLWRRWWLFFISVATFVCLYGVVQLSGGAEIHQGGARVDASFGNAIYLGVYLMFSILIAGWLAIESKGWLRYSLVAFSVLAATILLFTASRGAFVGLVAGLGFASVLWLFASRKELASKQAKRSLGIALGVVLVLVAGLGTFYLARDSAFVRSEPALARLSSVFSLSEELKVRMTIWGIALKGVGDDPVTGWGQEGFNQVFNTYYEPSLYEQEPWFDRAHNTYLDWLVAGGIPAFVLFVATLLAGMLALYRADAPRGQRVLLASALVAYAVQALVAFDNLFSYVPFVLLLAMAHGAHARTVERVDSLPEVRSETGVGAASAGALLAGVLLVWTVNVPNVAAAYNLVRGVSPLPQGVTENLSYFKQALGDGSYASQEIREQLISFAARVAAEPRLPEEVRSAFTTLAVDEMRKEIAMSPNDARLRIQFAGALDAAGNEAEAIEQLEKALELSPRKQTTWLSYAYTLYSNGRSEDARAAFAKAYELDPSFDSLALKVASGLILTGDIVNGKALLVDAVGTTTPDDESLFFAYYQTKQWSDLIAVARTRVALDGGQPASRFRLAQAFAASGRFEQARSEIYATIAAHPSSRSEGEALIAKIFVPAQ